MWPQLEFSPLFGFHASSARLLSLLGAGGKRTPNLQPELGTPNLLYYLSKMAVTASLNPFDFCKARRFAYLNSELQTRLARAARYRFPFGLLGFQFRM
jgi:hypothetical protein